MLDDKVVEHKLSPQISHVTMETVTEGPTTPDDTDLSDLQDTLKSYDSLFENGPEPRNSSQTARPNYNELYEHYYAQYTKPKVKLGPRPRPSLEGRRPSTSGSAPLDVARPVSSLPAGLRSAARKTAEKKESKTNASSTLPAIAIPPPHQVPPMPEMPQSPASSMYSTRAPASTKSMPVSAYKSHLRSGGSTQERTRLMKAVEMRKKQQQAQQLKKEKATKEAAPEVEIKVTENQGEACAEDETMTDATVTTTEPDDGPAAQPEAETDADKETLLGDELPASSRLSSSGLAFADGHAETEDLNSAASISSPVSAQTHGSTGAPSTRPSSISEDEAAMDDSQKSEQEESHSADFVDEEQSVNSTPTVVPESTTPVPSVEVQQQSSQAPAITERAPSFDDADDSSKRDTLRPEEYEMPSQYRSNRESTIYMPSNEGFQQADGQFKRRNRESMLMPSSQHQSWYETKGKRRAVLDPLQASADNSDTEYLSDDSFMEELQSATVHQAKPMSVSKSPITPFFPRKSSATDLSTPPRSASSNYHGISRLSPDQTGRKISGGWPPAPKSDSSNAPKKINVSSGISQRIKALADKTNRESASQVNSASAALSTTSSTLAQRKSSFFATTPIETSPNGRSSTRLGTPPFLTSSASTTPDKKKQSAPVKSTVYNVQRGVEKPESVQVTARIVRDERTMKPTLAMPTESTPLDLHQSPLIIDHQKATMTPKSPTRGRPEPASPPPSSSHSREPSNAPSRASSESTWRSFGRRMSESKSVHSHDGEEKREDKKEKKDKKEKRTSKMFKRMSSSMSGMPWKNSSSNLALPENDMRSTSLASLREPPPPVHVGDLNIQFPDTLVSLDRSESRPWANMLQLWKRRWVEIDALGNLVLSPSKHNEKGIVKRFHLSDFRTPYPPDQDRQELPNSVVLDFMDGRTLQCACETYIAQAQVLQGESLNFRISVSVANDHVVLREAHDAWLAYNQAL
jgi:hypothetical protein